MSEMDLQHNKQEDSMGQQCVLVAKNTNGMQGCIKQTIASRLRKVTLHLYSILVSLSIVSGSGLPGTRGTSTCGREKRATKTIKGLELLCYERKSYVAGTVQPGEDILLVYINT